MLIKTTNPPPLSYIQVNTINLIAFFLHTMCVFIIVMVHNVTPYSPIHYDIHKKTEY